MSSGIEDIGGIKWELAVCLLFVWVVVYFCVWRGVKWTGKVRIFNTINFKMFVNCRFQSVHAILWLAKFNSEVHRLRKTPQPPF